jgi:2-iminobutanoate/2-iminopropanoate deaminase
MTEMMRRWVIDSEVLDEISSAAVDNTWQAKGGDRMSDTQNTGVRLINDIPGTAPAVGPYSQIAVAGDMVYLSGQLPIDPLSGRLVEGGIEQQTERVFDNIEALLKGAGLGLTDIVRCSVYLTDFSQFAAMNAVYEKRFKGHRPARETIGIHALALAAPIEITVIAYRGAAR